MNKPQIDWNIVKILPTDYTDYGGTVQRWSDDSDYPDCSCGCRWFLPLDGKLGNDWGVCANPDSPRTGLLTFEHQTGKDCYQSDQDLSFYEEHSLGSMSNPGNLDYEI